MRSCALTCSRVSQMMPRLFALRAIRHACLCFAAAFPMAVSLMALPLPLSGGGGHAAAYQQTVEETLLRSLKEMQARAGGVVGVAALAAGEPAGESRSDHQPLSLSDCIISYCIISYCISYLHHLLHQHRLLYQPL